MVYLNQSFKQSLDTGIDLTSYIEVKIKYRKPDGVEGSVTPTVAAPATDGIIYYEFEAGFLDVEGTWTLWSSVENDSGSFPGNQVYLEVNKEAIRITNAEYVGTIIDTSGVSDAKIEALITLAEADYLRIRNAPWSQGYIEASGELYNVYPSGANTTIAFMIEYMMKSMDDKDLTSEKTMTYSWTSSKKNISGYPASIVSSIKRYARGVI